MTLTVMPIEVSAMPTVKIRFPGGRYHATPWGHHVNEGLIEWPPSPCRLLRAFIACGFASQGWADIPPAARRLIDKLAAVVPSYHLPAASAAHSRHFMPIGALAKGREQTTLVFDTWANVENGELLVHWPCELDAEEADILGKLATALGYLGRSESWVEAQLTDEVSVPWNAVPCVENEQRGPGWEQVALMAAISPADYVQWRATRVQESLKPFQDQRKTAAIKKRETQAIEPFPPDLLACLTKDTAWWKGHGWSQPPGSRRVLYWRRSDALEVSPPPSPCRSLLKPVSFMLLALTTPTGNKSPLPPCSRTLAQGELLHRAIVGCAAKGGRIECPELTGRDHLGKPLHDYHRHSHVLPVDLDGDGRLDHIMIYAQMGLGAVAQQAIRTMKRTWTKGGVGELQVALVASGGRDDLRRMPAPIKDRIVGLLGAPGGATIWISDTPFVLPRFLKERGRNSLVGQVNAELASRKLPPATSVELCRDGTTAFRHYICRRRRGGTAPPADIRYALRIKLAQPVEGPLSLGYASHFGLGLFTAVE